VVPLRYAGILALLLVAASVWYALQDVGYDLAVFDQRLSETCESCGLYGYAIVLRLRSAERCMARADVLGQAARTGAARNLELAARLLQAQVSQEAAADALARALEVDPSRTDLRADLLRMRRSNSDASAGRELVSLAFGDEDPDALRVVAEGYAQKGRMDDALGCLRHAAELAPKRYAIRLALAHLQKQIGDTKAAVAEAKAAESLADGFHQRLAARDLLRALGTPLPSHSRDVWEHRYTVLGPLVAIALGFLLVLFTPCLLHQAGGLLGSGRRTARPST